VRLKKIGCIPEVKGRRVSICRLVLLLQKSKGMEWIYNEEKVAELKRVVEVDWRVAAGRFIREKIGVKGNSIRK